MGGRGSFELVVFAEGFAVATGCWAAIGGDGVGAAVLALGAVDAGAGGGCWGVDLGDRPARDGGFSLGGYCRHFVVCALYYTDLCATMENVNRELQGVGLELGIRLSTDLIDRPD